MSNTNNALLKKIEDHGSSFLITDEILFDQVAQEVASNIRKDGLWTKALSECQMHEQSAKALYIKYRADQLRSDASSLILEIKNKEHENYIRLLNEVTQLKQSLNDELIELRTKSIGNEEFKKNQSVELKTDFERKLSIATHDFNITLGRQQDEITKLKHELGKCQNTEFNLWTGIFISIVLFILIFLIQKLNH